VSRTRTLVALLGTAALAVAAATSSAQQAGADAAISILATNAITGPLTAIALEHERTGPRLILEFATSPSINRRLAAGGTAGIELLIAANPTVDQAIEAGQASADSRLRIGRVGIGVAVRQGTPRPDVASVDALEAALLAADAVVYSQGASGVYVVQMLERLGLMAELGPRAVQVPTGADMLERIAASGGNEIGMTQISEIGVAAAQAGSALVYVGPLPEAVQHYTAFDGVAMTGASQTARAFLRSLTAPPARALLEANDWDL
jgi:molybdate transport system substrate-binding protein